MRAMRVLAAISMTVGTALWVATCGGGDGGTTVTPPSPPPPPANRAPTTVGSLGTLTIEVGAEVTVDVASNFNDPDGDALTYSVATSDAAVASATVSGSTVAVTGVGAGTANITVTATDPGGLSATQTLGVTVETVNHPPTVVGGLDNQTVSVGDTIMADVAEFFEDPEGDSLTFSASSSDTTVASAAVDGSALTVVTLAEGSSTVTVTATDTADNTGSIEFTLTVEAPNRAPEITDTIPPQTLMVGDTARLDPADYFTDPDGDDLTYEAVSSETGIVTALIDADGMVEIGAQTSGSTVVTVQAKDPEGLSAEQQVMVTVTAPPPMIADTIPTHDMIVDSMVPLDMSPYFAGDGLTYTVMSSDEMVAMATADGSTVTTTGVGVLENDTTVSVAMLMVTATNAAGESLTQDSIMVRVHEEAYDSLPGLSVNDEGGLTAQLGATTFVLTSCLQLMNFPVPDVGAFTAFWTEWQRAVGSGWVTAQDNDKAHVVGRQEGRGGSLCPIKIEDEKYPLGIYRLVGHVQIGDEIGFYKTPTFEKKPPES